MNTKTKSAAGTKVPAHGTLYRWKKSFCRYYDLYILLIPVIAYYVIFCYVPMYGLQIAFKDYSPAFGYAGSKWVGLKHLKRFINSYYFERLISNTLNISLLGLVFSVPAPLILALLFEEVRNKKLKTAFQSVSYAPHFISTVIMCSMLTMFMNPETGFIDWIARQFGYEGIAILGEKSLFKWVFVLSGVWQGCGWGSVIYSAAIAGVNQELYEAARLDGASRLKQIWHVTLPGIKPTIIILTIMALGNIMGVGYEKVYLLQNPSNMQKAEVISTYVYKCGLQNAQYSFASMVGLFNNVINIILLGISNGISKKFSETSLW